MMRRGLRQVFAWAWLASAWASHAQTGAPPPAAPASAAAASRPAAAAPRAAASAPGAAGAASAASAPRPAAAAIAPRAAASASAGAERIEITGGRDSDTEQRRQSTAAKIVIGREEIDKFGDATLGEVLRRLPGVTTPGAPGRGGPPRMRGLGSGYTQLLIDGQRVPPGFSLEQLTPEQVERIEILRAPTAETGARAIAGTINIITREGFKKRINDLRLGLGYEHGRVAPGLTWTRNDSVDDFVYNVSTSLFLPRRRSAGHGTVTDTDLARGALVGAQETTSLGEERRTGLSLSGRLQWRLGESGDSLTLMPTLFANRGRTHSDFTLAQTLPAALPAYDYGSSTADSHFTNLRLGGQWRQRLGADGPRLELGGHVGRWQSNNRSEREEYRNGGALLRRTDDERRTRESSALLTLKASGLAGTEPGREHSLVAGAEIEGVQRHEERTLLQDGLPQLLDFGDTFEASTLRLAGYLQDEWHLDAHWAFHAGLRWEGITTRGDAGGGVRPVNRSSVWTPLVHLLWKPDPKQRDQVRLSLTRSYRAPPTWALIARPSINNRFPADQGSNQPNSPDSAGNPGLRPELATGLDLAFERYLEGGGILTANLFHRNIRNLMRSVITLETVSWSAFPRWLSRQQNIGDAVTQGIELEAKYRLDQLVAGATPVELRHNLALYRSRVEGVRGPDNRLDQQAKASANLGADYRLRGWPLTLGGNFNWVPGYRTQTADDRAVTVSGKRVVDVFALWTIGPEVALRLLANNLGAYGYASSTDFDYADPASGVPLRETSRSWGPSYTNWQLRLELKL
ncbi:MAG: TonB-dependent receptor [Rubrivivax sp.]